MVLIDPLLGARLVFILGITNLIGLVLILFTCRCFPNFLPQKVRETKIYRKIYSKHCWIWWFFIISVALHSVFAIVYFGNPF